MSIHVICRKYKELIQTGFRPSRKCTLLDLNIGDGSFQKFDDWIVDAISDAQQEGQDLRIE